METGAMTKRFGHEKLRVYQAELQLVAWLESVLPYFACSSDLLSKLDGSTTSMVLNTAEGNGRFTGKDQSKFLDTAYKATVQSVALIDVAAGDNPAALSQTNEGRNLLQRIAAMLTSLKKAVTHDA
jgi:four helix bundle protein